MSSATTKLRTFLAVEVVLFALASLLHRGIIARGFEHARAAVAEGIIALVLAIGLAINVYSPSEARAAALWTQGFALVGVCVGLAMILIGIGPRTGLDYGIHAVMALTLISGLVLAKRVS
jgi:hypothetical protein